ncbi:MAG: peptidoglycan-binding domain-containing protein [Ilumatobacteraceae bacterium]
MAHPRRSGRWTAATWQPLRVGSTGEYVRRAQRALRRNGYYAVLDTGVYDEATERAVLKEQQRYRAWPTREPSTGPRPTTSE